MSASPPEERSLASLERLSGAGRSAEVFAWDERTVLKLPRGRDLDEGLEREGHALEILSATPGLAPQVRGRVTLDGRAGLLLERIHGIDLLKEAEKKPWRIGRIGRELADVHVRFNSLTVPEGLPGVKSAIEHAIDSPLVPEGQRMFALAILRSLPGGESLCHLDFHPGNVMRGHDGELKVIDFANACRGDPDCDFAVTCALIKMGELPPDTPAWLRLAGRLARRWLLASYTRRYRQQRAVNDRNVEGWTTVFFAQRLADNIPEERGRLLRLLEDRMPRGA